MTDAALADDIPFPGMPEPPELWAVHIQGPDEFVPFLDKEKAEKLVAELDDRDAAERKRNNPHSAYLNAKLVPWPGSRESFAEALREENEL
ncbi:hypothetical protein ABZY58_11905 [Micromonospora tulbaghiae]|uniref:hypothetical protein n=1 Tax=Micromonospora tulbaghiae TaxID=479978 RepID=UPI0033A237C4